MEKLLVAKGVADKLIKAELSVDQAILDTSNLLGGMVAARTELKVSALLGDEAARKVSEAIAALTEARQAVVAAHRELDETRLRMGIRTKLGGGYDKPPKPDDAFEYEPTGRFQQVG